MPAYIPDGYTMEGEVKESPHAERVTFVFRPKVGLERKGILHQLQLAGDPVQKEEIVNEVISDAVIKWSLKAEKNGTVSIDPLHPKVKLSMFNQIMLNEAIEKEQVGN